MSEADAVQQAICKKRKKDRDQNGLSCSEARLVLKHRKTDFQTLKRQQLEDLKATIKQVKKEQKAALDK